jgi:outer membrane lipoprotein-sorting protein
MKYFRICGMMLIIAVFMTGGVGAQDATTIVQRCVQHMQGKSSYGEMKMTIVRPSWQRDVSFKTWTYGTDLSLIRITAPARDKGAAFLKRGNEIWNWQPSIRRTIKLPPSMMSQSWMGSDFTNDDLVKQSSMAEDYTHKIIGNEVLQGYPCYIINLTPKPNAAVVWGKVKLWISKTDYLQLKAEFYDQDGFLVNTLTGSKIKKMGDRLIPSVLEVTPADNPGQKTVIEQLSLRFDTGITPAFFSQQQLKSDH